MEPLFSLEIAKRNTPYIKETVSPSGHLSDIIKIQPGVINYLIADREEDGTAVINYLLRSFPNSILLGFETEKDYLPDGALVAPFKDDANFKVLLNLLQKEPNSLLLVNGLRLLPKESQKALKQSSITTVGVNLRGNKKVSFDEKTILVKRRKLVTYLHHNIGYIIEVKTIWGIKKHFYAFSNLVLSSFYDENIGDYTNGKRKFSFQGKELSFLKSLILENYDQYDKII